MLDGEFVRLMSGSDYDCTKYLPEIVDAIWQCDDYGLGESPFDAEAYNIDANGNHRLFYGRIVTFAYDVKGKRSIKFLWVQDVSEPTKMIFVQETHYVRDEDGRVLADRKIAYHSTDINRNFLIRPSLPPMKTWSFYIYGPRGLVDFVTNGDYYNVITDHAGSTRLVIKEGRVVSTYDYLSYEHLMRWSGEDPSVVNYLFTGQEWDRETGLYNFHFRLYDPQIGRFYQIDPKKQLISSYVYAGNSPLSLLVSIMFLYITLMLKMSHCFNNQNFHYFTDLKFTVSYDYDGGGVRNWAK